MPPESDDPGSPTPRRSSGKGISPAPQPEAEEDLISFDRSILVITDSESPVIHSPSPQAATMPIQSIDDLLLSSPPRIVVQEERQTSEHVISLTQDSVLPSEDLLNTEPSSPPRRRSPRLSALSRSPTPDPSSGTEMTPRSHSPRPSEMNDRSPRSRKRLRDGSEKSYSDHLLSPAKADWTTDSDITDNESDRQSSPRRRKRAKNSFDNRIDGGALQFTDSLSPESARILMTLATPELNRDISPVPQMDVDRSDAQNGDHTSTSTATSSSASTSDTTVSDTISAETPKRPPSSAQRPPPGTFNLISPSSPIKLTLTPALDNPNRTPARRVKISTDNNPHATEVAPGVVFTPSFCPPVGDPRRTPARRVPISETQSTDANRRSKSPGPSFPSPDKVSISNLQIADQKPANPPATSGINVRPVMKPSTLGKRPAKTVANIGATERPAPQSSSTKPVGLTATKRVPGIPQPGSRIPRMGSAPKSGLAARTSKLPMPASRNLSASTGFVSLIAVTLVYSRLYDLFNVNVSHLDYHRPLSRS